MKDPDTNEIRYVGQTKTKIKVRLGKHIYDAKNFLNKAPYKENWIRKLLKNNKLPILEVISESHNNEEADKMEYDLIKEYVKLGYKLTNTQMEGKINPAQFINHDFIKVIKYDLGGNFIKIFDNINLAIVGLNIQYVNNIRAVCKGKYPTAGGFQWRYLREHNADSHKNNIGKFEIVYHNERKIGRYSKTGELLEEYESIAKAANSMNLKDARSIRRSAADPTQSSRGFKWKYIGE